MPRYCKKDMSHNARAAEMRTLGLHVEDTTQAGGALLDMSVRHRGTGRQFYVEVKNNVKGTPTKLAREFIASNPEACFVVRSQADVIALWDLLRR
jgi:hypothetical protein